MKKIAISLFIGFVLGSGIFLSYTKKTITDYQIPAGFHEHADFAVFINGEQFDFSLQQFMSIEPCVIAQHELIPTAFAHGDGDSLSEIVHLHDTIGTTVHMHAQGVTWHDFFASLGMEFSDTIFTDHNGNITANTETHNWRFFIDNTEVQSLENTEIRDLQKVLLTYGPEDRSQASINAELVQITNDACYYSESCLHRGSAPYESCGDSPPKPKIIEYLNIQRD